MYAPNSAGVLLVFGCTASFSNCSFTSGLDREPEYGVMQLGNDRLRGSCGNGKAKPQGAFELRIPGFCDSRHIRQASDL